MGATCSRHAPRSHMPDFSRSNARGRGDLHSDLPKLRMDVPKHGRPGIRQDWRGMSAASSPFRQKGDSRLAATGRSGFRQRRSTGWAGRVQYQHRHSRSEIRAKMRVFRGPDDRQAPIFRQESEGGIRRRIRKQPGGESGRHWCLGMEPSVASSWHAWSAIWRLTPRPWERRMLRSG